MGREVEILAYAYRRGVAARRKVLQ